MSHSRIPSRVRERIRIKAGDRCGYCRCPQHLVYGLLEIEHLHPTGCGGTDDEDNLWLAWSMCNTFRGMRTHAMDAETQTEVPLFDPRIHDWHEHFAWSENVAILVGRTAIGRATVAALRMNNETACSLRLRWATVNWHPPAD